MARASDEQILRESQEISTTGFGGVLSIGVVGVTVGSKAFVDGLRLISNMTKYVHPHQGLRDQKRGSRALLGLIVMGLQRWRLQNHGNTPVELNAHHHD
jgi:hypothetical protein